MKLKKKSIKKWPNKRPELTCQNYNSGHKTKITPWKVNWNKLWILIPNQLNVGGWD